MVEWTFDATNDNPLHFQLERRLKQQIIAGKWQPGERIPSERDIMELTGLSRATIRQALNSLVHQNVLQKVHGSGTFVARPKFEQPLRLAYSFSEQFRLLGQTLSDTLIRQDVEQADDSLAERMELPVGADVVRIERVRALQDRLMIFSTTFVPLTLCPGFASVPLSGSLYRRLTEDYKLPVVRATDRLEALAAEKWLAHHLAVRVGSPMMYVERTAYTTGDRILHLGENYIRGDMCRFSIDLQEGQPTTLQLTDRALQD